MFHLNYEYMIYIYIYIYDLIKINIYIYVIFILYIYGIFILYIYIDIIYSYYIYGMFLLNIYDIFILYTYIYMWCSHIIFIYMIYSYYIYDIFILCIMYLSVAYCLSYQGFPPPSAILRSSMRQDSHSLEPSAPPAEAQWEDHSAFFHGQTRPLEKKLVFSGYTPFLMLSRVKSPVFSGWTPHFGWATSPVGLPRPWPRWLCPLCQRRGMRGTAADTENIWCILGQPLG